MASNKGPLLECCTALEFEDLGTLGHSGRHRGVGGLTLCENLAHCPFTRARWSGVFGCCLSKCLTALKNTRLVVQLLGLQGRTLLLVLGSSTMINHYLPLMMVRIMVRFRHIDLADTITSHLAVHIQVQV